jgi:hypothetical protein
LKRPIQLAESLHLTTKKSIQDAPLLACSYLMEPLGGYFVDLRQKITSSVGGMPDLPLELIAVGAAATLRGTECGRNP